MKATILKLSIIIGIVFYAQEAMSQTQVVKGQILDAQAEYPLIGATIVLLGSDPIVGVSTDLEGRFRLEAIPVGRNSFGIQSIGYKKLSIPNVLVTSGKEVVLEIKLEESIEKLDEVVVTANTNKDLPINELAKVSARTFSLEEVTRFSGGRNDVARLAASFAGVSTPNDSRNDIVVRGNAPTGLLWRIEGIPIATTNHYATLGTTGGPVSALNTNLLRTSDFITSAFPSEYGNANAAVFDINFRSGNKDKHEFTGQLSAFSGLEFMAEGPLSKKNNSSYVASYRYGIASLAATGTSAIPFYQDFSFKLNFGESKIGRFELFGLGGLSSIDFLGADTDETDLFANPDEDAFVNNKLGFVGLSHLLRLNKNTYIKSTISTAINQNEYISDNLITDDGVLLNKYRANNVNNQENRFTFTSTLNRKINAKWSIRAGVIEELYDIDFFFNSRDNRPEIPDDDNDGIPDFLLEFTNIKDTYVLSQAFIQGSYNFSDDMSSTFGIHTQYHSFTEKFAVEPRLGLSWQFDLNQRLSFGYGLHSQSVPSPILFFEEYDAPSGNYFRTNSNLDFTKSHHFVLGYDRNLGPDWRLKAELYYQYLFNVPVESESGSYSILNEGADFQFEDRGSLVNDGTGTNLGVEMTLEKFFSKGYYALVTASIFDSRYKGSDGIDRSTAFNNNYVTNILVGKEWKWGKGGKNAWTFDSKLTTSGGKPFTPIDLESTRVNAGDQTLFEELAFSQTYGQYFRWDVKFGMRVNSSKRNVSHQFFIDFQNVTNRKNEFERRYNEVTDEINVVDQIGFFPDVLYRIQF